MLFVKKFQLPRTKATFEFNSEPISSSPGPITYQFVNMATNEKNQLAMKKRNNSFIFARRKLLELIPGSLSSKLQSQILGSVCITRNINYIIN